MHEEEKIKMVKERKEFMERRALILKEKTQNYISKSIPGAGKRYKIDSLALIRGKKFTRIFLQ